MKFNNRTSKKFLHIIDKYCALDLGRASSGPGGYGYVQSVMGYLGLALVFAGVGALRRGGVKFYHSMEFRHFPDIS